jgi:hypothetical protein
MPKYRLQELRPTRSVHRDPFPNIEFAEEPVTCKGDVVVYCIVVFAIVLLVLGTFK